MSVDLRAIIAGGGHVGYHMAELLDSRGHDVVIIEEDKERCEFLNDQYVATVIDGDATRPSVLRQAQPERSDVIASMIGDSVATNIFICSTARGMAPEIDTVARIDQGDQEEYEDMVDAVVFPEELAAHSAANEVIQVCGGGVRTIEEFSAHLELLEIEVSEDSPAANKRFDEIGFPRGSVIIQRRDDKELATGDTVLAPGVRYLVAVNPETSNDLIRLMRG